MTTPSARSILGTLAIVFLVLGGVRAFREGQVGPAARAWLLIGAIFGIVSVVSWLSTHA
ncbi:MAG TPA: hypothetical protein VI653_13630 [Steroidobacteraceae bacterium]